MLAGFDSRTFGLAVPKPSPTGLHEVPSPSHGALP